MVIDKEQADRRRLYWNFKYPPNKDLPFSSSGRNPGLKLGNTSTSYANHHHHSLKLMTQNELLHGE